MIEQFSFTEPVADPTTCPVIPGKDTTVEILTDNKSLGLFFVGGKDTLITVSIFILILPIEHLR